MVLCVDFPMVLCVDFSTLIKVIFSKKFATVENILSLKRRFTFKRQLHKCDLTDGYLSVG